MPSIRALAIASARPLPFLTGNATPARADGFISPFIGFNFGGDSSNCASLTNCAGSSARVSASRSEPSAEYSDSKRTSAIHRTSSARRPAATTRCSRLMSNLMLVIPAGSIQPYGLIGLGLMAFARAVQCDRASRWTSNLAGVGASAAALNIFFGHTFGIRGDLRHLRTLQDVTLGCVRKRQGRLRAAAPASSCRF